MSQVSDYDVANAAGNVVRAELNLILDAIKTCNAGTQNNLGTTSPYQLFADTTNNKLNIKSNPGSAFSIQIILFFKFMFLKSFLIYTLATLSVIYVVILTLMLFKAFYQVFNTYTL